jgi:hypothetical protein
MEVKGGRKLLKEVEEKGPEFSDQEAIEYTKLFFNNFSFAETKLDYQSFENSIAVAD